MTEEGADDLQGASYLARLKVFLDVVYAVLFVKVLDYLPQFEDMAWKDKPLGLLQLLMENATELLRIFIGLGLTLIYWNLNNRLLGPLVRTNGRHALLALLQMVFVCLFLYFALADPDLSGGPSSPALQAASLAIAGFIGLGGWAYARKHQLVDERMTEEERDKLARSRLIEPITALLNTPVAWVGPMAWTAGWFTIPLLVAGVLKRRDRAIRAREP
jgi:uncharacterized membrane protein